jgi:hypothetical protein
LKCPWQHEHKLIHVYRRLAGGKGQTCNFRSDVHRLAFRCLGCATVHFKLLPWLRIFTKKDIYKKCTRFRDPSHEGFLMKLPHWHAVTIILSAIFNVWLHGRELPGKEDRPASASREQAVCN